MGLMNRNTHSRTTCASAEQFEVKMAIEMLKGQQSPGIDQIPAELIEVGGRTICSVVDKLINSLWNKQELPEEWRSRSLYLI